jgi:AcrR family transcriptional regulator
MVLLNRKEREFQSRRAEILKAAEQLFATKGFYETTMAEIAEAAEFGTGTLYKFFEDKRSLYIATLEEKAEELFSFVRSEVSHVQGSINKLCRLVTAHLSFFEENREFFKIYIRDRYHFEWNMKDEFGEKVHVKYVSYISFVSEVIKEGIRGGEIKEVDPSELAHALTGMINSFIFQWVLKNAEEESLTAKGRTIVSLFLNGAATRPQEAHQELCQK